MPTRQDQLNVRVSHLERRELERLADAWGVTLSDALREAVRRALREATRPPQ